MYWADEKDFISQKKLNQYFCDNKNDTIHDVRPKGVIDLAGCSLATAEQVLHCAVVVSCVIVCLQHTKKLNTIGFPRAFTTSTSVDLLMSGIFHPHRREYFLEAPNRSSVRLSDSGS